MAKGQGRGQDVGNIVAGTVCGTVCAVIFFLFGLPLFFGGIVLINYKDWFNDATINAGGQNVTASGDPYSGSGYEGSMTTIDPKIIEQVGSTLWLIGVVLVVIAVLMLIGGVLIVTAICTNCFKCTPRNVPASQIYTPANQNYPNQGYQPVNTGNAPYTQPAPGYYPPPGQVSIPMQQKA